MKKGKKGKDGRRKRNCEKTKKTKIMSKRDRIRMERGNM